MKVLQKAPTLLTFSNMQTPVYREFPRHLNGWSLKAGLTVLEFCLQIGVAESLMLSPVVKELLVTCLLYVVVSASDLKVYQCKSEEKIRCILDYN